MRRILLRAEAPELSVETVDEATSDPLDTVAAGYHVVIPADHLTAPPLIADGVNAAFLCTDYHAFEHVRRMDLPGDLLFMPSAVARLDLLRDTRRTLVATRPIQAGTVIGPGDLGEVLSGTGLDVAWRDQVLGRTVLYDLREGAAIDFGVLSEDSIGDNRRHSPDGAKGELV